LRAESILPPTWCPTLSIRRCFTEAERAGPVEAMIVWVAILSGDCPRLCWGFARADSKLRSMMGLGEARRVPTVRNCRTEPVWFSFV